MDQAYLESLTIGRGRTSRPGEAEHCAGGRHVVCGVQSMVVRPPPPSKNLTLVRTVIRLDTHSDGRESYDNFVAAAGPGGWNDADQLIIGETTCPGLPKGEAGGGMECANISHVQEETQMALVSPATKLILLTTDKLSIRPSLCVCAVEHVRLTNVHLRRPPGDPAAISADTAERGGLS